MIKPILFNTEMVGAILDGSKTVTRRLIKLPIYGYLENEPPKVKPPYQVGDILYVRETFTYNNNPDSNQYGQYEYYTDYDGAQCQALIKWKPSIHMPKEAARIWLKVTDVRVERLQEITVEECRKEGIYDDYKTTSQEYHDLLIQRAYPETFKKLWNSTIKKEDMDRYGWKANPWVWVIEFERCEKPEE